MIARPLCFLVALTVALAAEDRRKFHSPPKPLAKDAVTEDWTRFLGPRDDGKSRETRVLERWPDAGPSLVWEVEKGDGYTTPAIKGERLTLFHRVQGHEVMECRKAETGELLWEDRYPVDYQDRYGYSNGPRGSPVIAGDQVYALGVTSMLSCWELASGKSVWRRDLRTEFGVPQYFFGSGGSPLVAGEKLIVNVGGKPETPEGVNVAAFDRLTGKTIWEAKNPWGASYASPTLAKLHGRERVLVFAGGESRPPLGGLLMLDPADGRIIDQFPWRAQKYESVNAASPVVWNNRVFVTESYRIGGVMLEVDRASEKLSPAWKAPAFASHWCTPIEHEGHLYGFDGEKTHLAQLVCFDCATGKELWRDDLRWREKVDGQERTNGAFRGSLLHVEGRFLCLGEGGALLWLDLSPKGCKVLRRTQLFEADQSWSAPAIHRGLVYLSQHGRDFRTSAKPRLLCYDFRAAP